MKIKDVERHHPVLKLLAGYMTEVVVTVNRIDTERRLSFSMGRTIEMTVEYESDYDNGVQPGSRILIDIDTGEIRRIYFAEDIIRSVGGQGQYPQIS